MEANREAFDRWRDRPADAARRLGQRDLSTTCSAPRCRRRCCSRRSACSRSSTPRPSWRSRGRAAAGAALHPQHGRLAHDRGGRRGGRRRAALVPALLADATAISRPASSAVPSRRATKRSSSRSTPGCSAGARAICSAPTCRFCRAKGWPTTSPTRSSGPPCRAPPEEDLGAAIGHWAYQFSNPDGHLGRPRLAARADLAADRAQGHPPPRRRDARAAGRGRRRDRLEPRRAPGRRRDRRARRAAGCPEAVGEGFPVLFDSGIRTGSDVIKALALGADAVASGGPTSGVWRWAGRRASNMCCAACWPSWIYAGAERSHGPRPGRARFCNPPGELSRLAPPRCGYRWPDGCTIGEHHQATDADRLHPGLGHRAAGRHGRQRRAADDPARLGGGLAAQQWVVNGYLLTLGSLILIGGSLGDLFGERRVFALGVAGFGVASLCVRVCAEHRGACRRHGRCRAWRARCWCRARWR